MVSHKCGVSDLETHMISATSIEFRRKKVCDDEKEQFKFGDTVNVYPAKCEYVSEKYTSGINGHAKAGYNLAILSFRIEDKETMTHYSKHTQRIVIQNGIDTLKVFTRLNTVFGFVNTGANDLGWCCSSTEEYEVKTHEITNMQYLEQFREGDRNKFKGSNGSIFFIKE
eukprot:532192_1